MTKLEELKIATLAASLASKNADDAVYDADVAATAADAAYYAYVEELEKHNDKT